MPTDNNSWATSAANHPTTGLNYFTTNGTTILPYVPSNATGDFPTIPSYLPSNNLPYFPTLEKEKKSVRGLYEVFIVDPEVGKTRHFNIVANDEASARVNAAIQANIEDADDHDIIVRFVGAVREKKDKAK